MHISRRTWYSAALVIIAAGLLWMRIGSLRHAKTPPAAAIPDRALTNPLNQPGGSPAPPDAYEVYSALYQAPMDEPLAFSDASVTDIPQVNGSCLKPASPKEHELTDAFEAANRQSRRWEKAFAIPQGYRLFSRAEAAHVQACLEIHGQNAARCAAYKDIRHVRFLGVPGFDVTHTRALVSIVKMCGRYCGSGGIFAVEKNGGKWQRSQPSDFTRECSWMY